MSGRLCAGLLGGAPVVFIRAVIAAALIGIAAPALAASENANSSRHRSRKPSISPAFERGDDALLEKPQQKADKHRQHPDFFDPVRHDDPSFGVGERKVFPENLAVTTCTFR